MTGFDGEEVLVGTSAASEGDLAYYEPPPPKKGRIHAALLEDPISQLNAPAPILLDVSATVGEAVALMRKRRFGSVIVVEGDRLAGIFTEHDLIAHDFIEDPAGRETEAADVPLAEVMTKDPHAIREEDTLAHAVNLMADGGYRHIPVVKDDRPVGFISVRGILQYLAENALTD